MSSHISPQSDSTPSPGTARSAGATAVFTLDRSGTILSANAGAGNFWQTESTELVGKPFVSLFAFEVTSDDPDMLEAQWDVLCSSAVEQRIPLAIQLVEGGPQTEVRVQGYIPGQPANHPSHDAEGSHPLCPAVRCSRVWPLRSETVARPEHPVLGLGVLVGAEQRPR